MDERPATTTNSENFTDDTNRPVKPPEIRPHYYTTFQVYCCENKESSSTKTKNCEILPIPKRIKDDAEVLLNELNGILIQDLQQITKCAFAIPNIFFDPNALYQFDRYLIDRPMLRTMKDEKIINWIPSLKKLYPIRTSGNGNCLLHAVLIATIGIHDNNLYLRDRLIHFMESNKDVLKNHWKMERLKSDKAYGIQSEESVLESEWNELCNIVRYENTENGESAPSHLEFLEAVHIFAISNLMCRPIIILSEDVIRNKTGEPISVNDIFGIYLPIISPLADCIRQPIVLAYDRSHFCPLQTDESMSQTELENLLPLYLSFEHKLENRLLPIRFLGEDETDEHSKKLINDYLCTKTIDYNFDSTSTPVSILCTELSTAYIGQKYNFLLLYYKYLKDFFEIRKPKAIEERQRELEKREKDRQLKEYVANQTNSRTSGGSTAMDSSRQPMSSRSNDPTNNISAYNQNGGTYIPYYSDFATSMSINEPRQSRQSPSLSQIHSLDSTDARHQLDVHKQYSSNNIINNNEKKYITTTDIQLDNKINGHTRERPLQKPIPISVHRSPIRSSSNKPDLQIYDKRQVTNVCRLCKRTFHDFEDTDICPECEYETAYAAATNDVARRPTTTQTRRTNMYPAGYTSSFPTLPTPRTIERRNIRCPYCQNINLNYGRSSSPFMCSACKSIIPSVYLRS